MEKQKPVMQLLYYIYFCTGKMLERFFLWRWVKCAERFIFLKTHLKKNDRYRKNIWWERYKVTVMFRCYINETAISVNVSCNGYTFCCEICWGFTAVPCKPNRFTCHFTPSDYSPPDVWMNFANSRPSRNSMLYIKTRLCNEHLVPWGKSKWLYCRHCSTEGI